MTDRTTLPGHPLTFAQLRAANEVRCQRWHGPDSLPWTGADWSNAMCGEAGETANVVKKLRRQETNIETSAAAERDGDREMLLQKLGLELADTVAYLDLLALHYGLDLGACVTAKFNMVSNREGFPEHLEPRVPGFLAAMLTPAAKAAL